MMLIFFPGKRHQQSVIKTSSAFWVCTLYTTHFIQKICSSQMILAAIFSKLDLWFNRLLKVMQIGHRGLWLGLLDRDKLQQVTEMRYGSWDTYLSQSHNEAGLTSWEEGAIEEFYAACHSLLITSAGAGREVVSLSRRGYQVVAFDCVEPLVKRGRQILAEAGIAAELLTAEADKVPPGLDLFDGLIIGWGGYMHIVGRKRRIAFLEALHEHVEMGAPLLLSFFTRPPSSKYFRAIAVIANFLRRLRRRQELVEVGDHLYGLFNHYFIKEEIEAELAEAGFELVRYRTTPYGHAVGRAL